MKLLLSLFFLLYFIPYYTSGQKTSLFFDIGIVELREKFTKKYDLTTSLINPSIPVSIGVIKKNDFGQFLIGYNFQNLALGEHPVYNGYQETKVHVFNKPYYIHSLRFQFSKELFHFSKNKYISPFLEVHIGYIPENKWEQKALPNNLESYGFQYLYNLDSNLIFESRYYPRLISDIFASLKMGINIDCFLKNFNSVTISPFYSIGLNSFYKIDYWFTDFDRKISGKTAMINNGAQFGFMLRYNVNFKNDSKKH